MRSLHTSLSKDGRQRRVLLTQRLKFVAIVVIGRNFDVEAQLRIYWIRVLAFERHFFCLVADAFCKNHCLAWCVFISWR